MRAVRSPQLMQMTTPSKPNQFVVVQAKLPVGLVAALDDFIKTQQLTAFGTLSRSSVIHRLVFNLLFDLKPDDDHDPDQS